MTVHSAELLLLFYHTLCAKSSPGMTFLPAVYDYSSVEQMPYSAKNRFPIGGTPADAVFSHSLYSKMRMPGG